MWSSKHKYRHCSCCLICQYAPLARWGHVTTGILAWQEGNSLLAEGLCTLSQWLRVHMYKCPPVCPQTLSPCSQSPTTPGSYSLPTGFFLSDPRALGGGVCDTDIPFRVEHCSHLLSALKLVVGLCVSGHLLQEDASLMWSESYTLLYSYRNKNPEGSSLHFVTAVCSL